MTIEISAPNGRIPVVVQWEMSNFFGWGIYATNIMLHLAHDPDLAPRLATPVAPGRLVIDGLRLHVLTPALEESRDLQETLAKCTLPEIRVNAPVLTALNDKLIGGNISITGVLPRGRPAIGLIFICDTEIDAAALERGRRHDIIVAGSNWNRDLLIAAGLERVEMVFQGVDTSVFHPAPRSGFYRNRFLIFSGGKLEYRKAQDLVMRAFGIFSKRHADAYLITAWHSPWPSLAKGVGFAAGCPEVPFGSAGLPDIKAWAAAMGVEPGRVSDLGAIPNAQMAPILRDMDVALFPNRCEPGTNLVAMECMACAVPSILSRNTGHLDIIGRDDCYVLDRQLPVGPRRPLTNGTEGWGECDVDEMVERLEEVYRGRDEAKRRAAVGAEKMARLSWRAQIGQLKKTILPVIQEVVR